MQDSKSSAYGGGLYSKMENVFNKSEGQVFDD